MSGEKATVLKLSARHWHPNGGVTYGQPDTRGSVYVGPKFCGDNPPDEIEVRGVGLQDANSARLAKVKEREKRKAKAEQERQAKKEAREKQRQEKKAQQEAAAAKAKEKAEADAKARKEKAEQQKAARAAAAKTDAK